MKTVYNCFFFRPLSAEVDKLWNDKTFDTSCRLSRSNWRYM